MRLAGLDLTSLRQRVRGLPAAAVDGALALVVAIALTAGIVMSPPSGRRPDAVAFLLGLTIAALVLVRRRWPVGVLLASAAVLQLYYRLGYEGLVPAVPLAVALATAWAAGHPGWALAVAAWFATAPLVIRTLTDSEATPQLLRESVPNLALLTAVLLLGEAVRNRRALDRERLESERLLLNVLPASIAERLKRTDAVIADRFADVTVLFADIEDFTRRSDRVAPERVVEGLNDLFTAFDRLARRYGLEKIKTVGDAYMVVGGLPDPRPGHAEAGAEMALAMRDEVAGRTHPGGQPLAVRIGMDTGPVVAGVIGTSKFSYDLWGDTVNTASRMESHGVTGCIQVTTRTYERLRDRYRFQRRGPIPVKGKGEMVTWFLLGRNDDPG
jgi:class 3 adenylate cyclase